MSARSRKLGFSSIAIRAVLDEAMRMAKEECKRPLANILMSINESSAIEAHQTLNYDGPAIVADPGGPEKNMKVSEDRSQHTAT